MCKALALRLSLVIAIASTILKTSGCTGKCETPQDCPQGQFCNYYGECVEPAIQTTGLDASHARDASSDGGSSGNMCIASETLDPSSVHILGFVAPGISRYGQGLGKASSPDSVVGCLAGEVGAPDMVIRPTDNSLLYILNSKLYKLAIDTMARNGGTCMPVNLSGSAVDNDIEIPTPPCAQGIAQTYGLPLLMNPTTGNAVYTCRGAPDTYYDQTGSEIWSDANYRLIAIGAQGILLEIGLPGMRVVQPGGSEVPVTGVTRDQSGFDLGSARSYGSGFRIVYRELESDPVIYELWRIQNNGIASAEVTHSGFPSEITATIGYSSPRVDAAGNIYVVAKNHESVIRFPHSGGPSTVIFTPSDNSVIVDLRMGEVITGP